jgi:hypothetical protein
MAGTCAPSTSGKAALHQNRGMRVLFSLVALLLVVWVVMKLSATQLQTLAPAAGSSAPNAAQQAADKVQRAIEQGAAQRAAEAASAGGR